MLREIIKAKEIVPHTSLSVSGQKGLNNKTYIKQ
jgi:hypothetical protein